MGADQIMSTTLDGGSDDRRRSKPDPSGKPEPTSKSKSKYMILRRLVQLMLEDIEIYMDQPLSEADVKNYDWPKKYIGQTYHQAMLDCSAVMLRAVLHHHCPNSQVGSQGAV